MLTIEMIQEGRRFDKELVLCFLSITDADIPLICNYLIEHPEITHLDLSYNEITDIGAKALASNQQIEELIIGNNAISEEGEKMLREQDPVKQSNYGLQSGVTSVVPSLLKLSLFKATHYGLDLATVPQECRALKTRQVDNKNHLEETSRLVREMMDADSDRHRLLEEREWRLQIYELSERVSKNQNDSLGYRLGSTSNTTETPRDLESLRARRIAYFEPDNTPEDANSVDSQSRGYTPG